MEKNSLVLLLGGFLALFISALILFLYSENKEQAISLVGNTVNINCTKVMSNISRYSGDIAFKVDGKPATRIYFAETCAIFINFDKQPRENNETSN